MTDDDLTTWIAALLNECVDRGMDVPLVFTWVTANGSVIVIKYAADGAGGMSAEILAEHVEPGGLELPVNCMICDRSGIALRAAIQHDGIVYF